MITPPLDIRAAIEAQHLEAAYLIALCEVLGFALPADRPLSARQLWRLVNATREERTRAYLQVTT